MAAEQTCNRDLQQPLELAWQGKRSWLVVYDVATGGLRIRAVKHKYEIATQWDQVVVEESLHKRKDVRFTVGADGDGVMALIKEESLHKRKGARVTVGADGDVVLALIKEVRALHRRGHFG